MRPQNHHLLSLAHSPDLIGLLFSILDQFTGKTSIIASGEFIRVMPKEKKNEIDQFELRGSNVISKIFCGFINWLGHCLSDLVGSNTTRADPAKRGTGLPIPGFELFQFISLPPGPQEKIAQDLADLSVKVFESGYDARFGIALSIPVITSVTGEQEFMGILFFVNDKVLIPRQDTELLAEEARRRLSPGDSLLDVCTGSGCLAVSLMKLVPGIRGTA